MELAIAAAPKPLSMLTTETPLAQLFSMPSRAAQPAETGAVADAGRHGDDRHVDQAADHARERPLHPGDDDDDAGGHEALVFGQEPVESGDADVIHLSTWLPMISAVTAASSATGRSAVPAAAIDDDAFAGRAGACGRVIVRASSWKVASGTFCLTRIEGTRVCPRYEQAVPGGRRCARRWRPPVRASCLSRIPPRENPGAGTGDDRPGRSPGPRTAPGAELEEGACVPPPVPVAGPARRPEGRGCPSRSWRAEGGAR